MENMDKGLTVQVNLCQKLLFLHQLTYNMTTDCSLNYKFTTWKFLTQNMRRTCCLQKMFLTNSVHNLFCKKKSFWQWFTFTKMSGDRWAENTPKFICQNCLPMPKNFGFRWKKASLGVRSPCCPQIVKRLWRDACDCELWDWKHRQKNFDFSRNLKPKKIQSKFVCWLSFGFFLLISFE